MAFVSCHSASITKSAAHISQERFDLELPNFIPTYIPTHSTGTLTMLSPATSSQHVTKFEKPAENAASDGFGLNFSGAVRRRRTLHKNLAEAQMFWVVNRWNALDNETAMAPSVIAFKSRLSRIRDTRMVFFMDNSDKPYALRGFIWGPTR